MKIGIVNDLPMAAEALRRAVALAPEHQVVWLAKDGAEALKWLRKAADQGNTAAFNNLGREILIAFNTSLAPLSVQVEVDEKSVAFSSLLGECSHGVSAPGSLKVTLPPLGVVACLEETR